MHVSTASRVPLDPIITNASRPNGHAATRRVAAAGPPTDARPNAAPVQLTPPARPSGADLAPLERIAVTRRAALAARAETAAPIPASPDAPAAPASSPISQAPPAAAPALTTGSPLAESDEPAVPLAPKHPEQPPAPTLTHGHVPLIEAAFGARVGDERFDATLDATGDGVINGMDITYVLNASPTPPAAETPAEPTQPTATPADIMTRAELVGGILDAFGEAVGVGDARSAFDLSGDGRIDGLDLSFALNRSGPPLPAPEGAAGPRPSVRTITEAYGSRTGHAGFASTLDLNGDGVINGGDLAVLLNRATDTEA